MDAVLHKLEGQVRRYKEKIQDHRRTPPTGDVAVPPRAARKPARSETSHAHVRLRGARCDRPQPDGQHQGGRHSRDCGESARAGQFKNADVDDVVRAIQKREMLGSTGIGRGVAIPHTKHNSVERLTGTVAVSSRASLSTASMASRFMCSCC